MAQFVCSACSHSQEVADEYLGRTTKCPKCETAGVIEPKSDIKVLRCSGGSIQTVLSSRIRLNEKSSLEREFITIVDERLPVRMEKCVGVKTIYESGSDYSAGGYKYTANYSIRATESLSAFEIRFLLFDLWGRHIQTLTSTEIRDIPSESVQQLDASWVLYSENEACEYYASIAFIATIRTAKGVVIEADLAPIIDEGKRFSSKFSDVDVEPKKPKQ